MQSYPIRGSVDQAVGQAGGMKAGIRGACTQDNLAKAEWRWSVYTVRLIGEAESGAEMFG